MLKQEDTCMNLYRVINEDTSGNPVYVDENRKIYNSIYYFKEGMKTNKKNCLTSSNENRVQGKEM